MRHYWKYWGTTGEIYLFQSHWSFGFVSLCAASSVRKSLWCLHTFVILPAPISLTIHMVVCSLYYIRLPTVSFKNSNISPFLQYRKILNHNLCITRSVSRDKLREKMDGETWRMQMLGNMSWQEKSHKVDSVAVQALTQAMTRSSSAGGVMDMTTE